MCEWARECMRVSVCWMQCQCYCCCCNFSMPLFAYIFDYVQRMLCSCAYYLNLFFCCCILLFSLFITLLADVFSLLLLLLFCSGLLNDMYVSVALLWTIYFLVGYGIWSPVSVIPICEWEHDAKNRHCNKMQHHFRSYGSKVVLVIRTVANFIWFI